MTYGGGVPGITSLSVKIPSCTNRHTRPVIDPGA